MTIKILLPDEPLSRNAGFFRAVMDDDEIAVKAFIESGMIDVNYVDPRTGYTALHVAAARRAREILKMLTATGQCDFAKKDRSGRTPADVALILGEDAVIARYLSMREFPSVRVDRPAGSPSGADKRRA